MALLEETILALALFDLSLFALSLLGAFGFEHDGSGVAAFDVAAFGAGRLCEAGLGLAVGVLGVAAVVLPGLGNIGGCPEAVGPTPEDAPGGDAGACPEEGEGAGRLPESAGTPIGTTVLGVVVAAVLAVVVVAASTLAGVEVEVVLGVEVRSGVVAAATDVGVSLGVLAIPGKDPWYAISDCGASGRYTRLSGATE